MDASVSLPLERSRDGGGLHLVEQVFSASKAIRRSLEELLAPAGLEGAEFLLLWNVAERGQQSQCELADRLGCSNAQISQLSDLLRRRGWLAAERDARDRRRQHWTLTLDGHDAMNRAQDALRSWCSRLESAVGPAELSPFVHALARLSAARDSSPARKEAA